MKKKVRVNNMELEFTFNDGGRSKYFKGQTGDCVVRAIAIATGGDYKVIYDDLFQANKDYMSSKNTKLAKQMKSRAREKSGTPRAGIYKKIFDKYLLSKGWKYVSCRTFGGTERTKLDQLMHLDNIIVNINRHSMCMQKGVVQDIWDSRYSEWLGVTSIKTANGYFIKE